MIVKMTHTYNYKVPHSHNNKIQTKYTIIVLPFNYFCVQYIISRHSGAFRSWLYSLCKILGMSTSKCRDTSLPYKLKASIFYVKFLFLCKTKTTPEGLTRKKIYNIYSTIKSWNKDKSEVEVKQYNPQPF